MKFLTSIDLNQNELQNAIIQNLSTPPTSPKAGQLYFNSVDKLLYQYTGTEWTAVGKPVESLDWSKIKNTPKTVAGYGIQDLKVDKSKKSVTIGKDTLENLVSDPNYVHTDTNFTQAEKNKLGTVKENAEPNKIDSVSVNGVNVPASSKNVDIEVPTKVSQLTNDKNYINKGEAPVQSVNSKTGAVELSASDVGALSTTGGSLTGELSMGSHKITNVLNATADNDAVNKKQMEDAIKAIGTVFDLKGTKPTKGDLPKSGNKKGDVWYVEDEKVGYIWLVDTQSPDGRWEKFGEEIDLSGYLTKAGLAKTTGSATDNAMTQKAVTEALNLKADKTTVNAIPVIVKTEGTIGTSATSAVVSYTGTCVTAYVVDNTGEKVMTDVDIASNTVTFSVAVAPKSALTCIVFAI